MAVQQDSRRPQSKDGRTECYKADKRISCIVSPSLNLQILNTMANIKGLYGKYKIEKITGRKIIGEDFFGNPIYEPLTEPVKPYAEYFVLRLDGKGEENHVNACRKALMTYADEIENYLPELAKDLRERYSSK